MAEPILAHDNSYDAISGKEVPFGASMTKNNAWESKPPQKRKFYGRE